ncbi:MFS transporter [Aquihabitans sp. G128]|uniref:MFS transporter n=1 Tax=Aquihabitans sp. G128 TaxID=2849779 RepID=UPI001C213398|nr:MFS transporter [Aquihabitans sp. G128]QXC63327.1 MFS transporter [Aquihabitans sp. G128]
MHTQSAAPPDPKRWIALVILSSALFIIVLDNTILNVAVPTIIRDFDTDVSSLQWVISGYSLVFASLLISFGRLGDILGRRKLFFAGAALFAIGSLVASLSQSVLQLFIGESLLEGVGAAMMLPATLSILSATFQGRERGVAFAVWGSVAGGAGALGPWVGGILTTDYSWRWAFRVNVVIAPLAILAGIFFVRDSRDERASGLDLGGVVAVTLGLVALVFGIIEAARYGWWKPVGDQSLGGWEWPLDAVSIVPVSLLLSVVFLAIFVRLELRRAAADKPVVFDFGDLVHRGFRYGLINTTVLAMGEFGAFFVLPIFLQAGLHLSAIRSGTWLLPAGAMAFVGGGVGGQLSRRFGPKYVITVGLAFEALGIWLYVFAFSPSTTFWSLLPALMLHGVGIGFATSQLTNVVLSDIPPQKAGSASGAAGMVRQVGTALGIALIGAIFVSQASSHVRHDLAGAKDIPPAVKEEVVATVSDGIGGGAPHRRLRLAHRPAHRLDRGRRGGRRRQAGGGLRRRGGHHRRAAVAAGAQHPRRGRSARRRGRRGGRRPARAGPRAGPRLSRP